jgi:CRP-like cAMP-binding protein
MAGDMSDAAVSLKGTYLVAGLTDEQMDEVEKLATVRMCPSGHLLCRIGDPADFLYVVLNGTLAVTTADGDKLGEIAAGSVVGEIGIVDVRQRTANVTCVGGVSVASIPIDALRNLMNANREMGFLILANLARVLAVRLRAADAKIDDLSDKAGDVWTHALG